MRAMTPRAGARLISIQQASDELGLPINTLDRLIATGALPVVELPHVRRRFLDRADIDDAITAWKRVAR
jgi:hypothetical protein